MDQKQLIDALCSILKDQQSISEYQLIGLLQAPPYEIFEAQALSEPLTLFQCHFVLFNGLYQLQQQWHSEKFRDIEIISTRINILPYTPNASGLVRDDPLKRYYLDWQNMLDTNEGDVERLLESFWRKMHRYDLPKDDPHFQEAKTILQIEGEPSPEQVKAHYRKLQHRHHPDKGGSVEQSKRVDWAYRILKGKC